MTAKQFLKQYEEANNKALQHKREYEKQMELIGSISMKMDGMPHGSNISKPTENDAIKLADRAKKLIEAEKKAVQVRQEVYEVIADVPDIEGQVLYEKYINLCSWAETADRLHYTVRGVQYAHGRALRIVAEKIK